MARYVCGLVACLAVVALVPACDRAGDEREAPRASGRRIDEPFADLYVVAGPKGAGRLFALDLLNLELQPLAGRRDLEAIVAVCGGEPVVRAGEGRALLILEDDALVDAPAGIAEGEDCWTPAAAGPSGAWRRLAEAPNGERILVAQGRRLGVTPVAGGAVQELGRTRLRVTSAVWPAR